LLQDTKSSKLHDWKDKPPSHVRNDWQTFVDECATRYHVEIGPEHTPLYVPPA
jgi:hypothetical protein